LIRALGSSTNFQLWCQDNNKVGGLRYRYSESFEGTEGLLLSSLPPARRRSRRGDWYADLHGVLLQLLRFEVEVEGVVAV